MAKDKTGADAPEQTVESLTIALEQANVTIAEKDEVIADLMKQVNELTATKGITKPIVKDSEGKQYVLKANVTYGGKIMNAAALEADATLVDALVKKGSEALQLITVEQ